LVNFRLVINTNPLAQFASVRYELRHFGPVEKRTQVNAQADENYREALGGDAIFVSVKKKSFLKHLFDLETFKRITNNRKREAERMSCPFVFFFTSSPIPPRPSFPDQQIS
jgi:hypothetical protein